MPCASSCAARPAAPAVHRTNLWHLADSVQCAVQMLQAQPHRQQTGGGPRGSDAPGTRSGSGAQGTHLGSGAPGTRLGSGARGLSSRLDAVPRGGGRPLGMIAPGMTARAAIGPHLVPGVVVVVAGDRVCVHGAVPA